MSATYAETESLGRNIRPLCEKDLPEVLDIERMAYSYPWPENVFRDCFRPNYRLWALESSGSLAGYAVVANLFDEAHLLNICIARHHRNSGMARQLLRHLVQAAAKDGMSQVILEVRESNHAAARLYSSEGFEQIGQRPGYYPSSTGREDARVLSLTLGRESR